MKKGFTIVEMLMVVGVLAVLMGIVTTAATASIRQARERRLQAAKQVLQSGIATYYAQKDEWPGKLDSWSDNGSQNGKIGYLSNSDYDEVVKDLLKESVGKSSANPMLDVTTLSVMPKSSSDGRQNCREFRQAVKKNQKHGKALGINEMTIVYQAPRGNEGADCVEGRYYRFIIQYNAEADSVTVMTREDFQGLEQADGRQYKWNGSERWF